MILVKHRIYGTAPATNLATIFAPPNSPLTVIHHVAPVGTTDSFLGARVQFQATVQVSATDPPPESWWPPCSITLIAAWTPSASNAVGNATGTSEHYLGSKVLGNTIVPSPTAPDEYTVLWRMEEDLVVDTARHDLAAAAGPSFNVGIVIYDFQPALTGIYAGVLISYEARAFSLWGSPP